MITYRLHRGVRSISNMDDSGLKCATFISQIDEHFNYDTREIVDGCSFKKNLEKDLENLSIFTIIKHNEIADLHVTFKWFTSSSSFIIFTLTIYRSFITFNNRIKMFSVEGRLRSSIFLSRIS